MGKVFVLTCDWDCGDGRNNQVLGVFAKQEDAEQEMKRLFEQDKIDSCFAGCFENGKLKEGEEQTLKKEELTLE